MTAVAKWKRYCRAVDAVVATTALLAIDSLFASVAGMLIETIATVGLIKGVVSASFGIGVLLICVLLARFVIAAFLNWMRPEQSEHLTRRIASYVFACTICISAAVVGAVVPPTQSVLLLAMSIAVAAFIALAVSRMTFGAIGGLADRQ